MRHLWLVLPRVAATAFKDDDDEPVFPRHTKLHEGRGSAV